MESTDLPIGCVIDSSGKRHFGLIMRDRPRTAMLCFERGSIEFRVVDSVGKPLYYASEYTGFLGLLHEAMRGRLPIDIVNLRHFEHRSDRVCVDTIVRAVEQDYIWQVAVPVACEISVPGPYFSELGAAMPLCIRAASLPRFVDEEMERVLIGAAHSSHWAEAPNLRDTVLGTAAAYVFAKSEGIAVNDPEGLRYIRTEAIVAELVATGKMPWVKERLVAMNGKMGALGV